MLCLPNVSRSQQSKREKLSLQKRIGTNLNARHVMHNHRMYNKPKKNSQVMPTETMEANWRQSERSQRASQKSCQQKEEEEVAQKYCVRNAWP